MTIFVRHELMRKMNDIPAKISVILPFYNSGNELDKAIQSIVFQTFTDWALILVSNNGSDTGLKIAQRWLSTDNRIRLIEEPQQGIAFALNAGLRMANTEYIARMDADDISHPERLSAQIAFLDKYKEIDVVSTQTTFDSAITGSTGYALFVEWQNSIVTPGEHAIQRFIESPLAHPSVMFRKSLIRKYGMYDTGPVPEDYELWLRWFDNDAKFHKIPRKLLIWTDHPQRLSRNHENYSKEAFFNVKCHYLAKWINRTVSSDKKIIVCGSSRIGRKRADLLKELGVDIYGFTDVKKRPNRQVNFIPYQQITDPNKWFLINFIGRRGVGEAIRKHFTELGFEEGRDLILAA